MSEWWKIPVFVMDFEGAPRTGVVEYGVVEWIGGKIAACHSRLCRPQEEISTDDTRLHGIAQSDTAECAPFSAEWERFSDWRTRGVFGAHHAPVEHHLLKGEWIYPTASPDFLRGGRAADWGPWIDTRRLYEFVYPCQPSYQLGELIERFGLQRELLELAEHYCPPSRRKAHCALFDALASTLLLQRLTGEPGFESVTLQWLLENSLPSAAKKQAIRQGELFD